VDKNFHYYCIRVLAEKAGFSPRHAQNIAYASQYTDDATEHGKMTIVKIPNHYSYPRWDKKNDSFDPICTAHSAKSWLARLWKWAKFYLKTNVQRQILMPFHFLPSAAWSEANEDEFDFVTRENSALANLVVDKAIDVLSQSKKPMQTYALIKVGIALHTYADTWSHDGFSGRHSSRENDIEKIRVKRGKRFKSVNPLEDAVSYAAPDVGHAEAGVFPDASDIHWTAKYANKGGRFVRDNSSTFLGAAEEIYVKLCAVSPKSAVPWVELLPDLRRCLQKRNAWANAFPDIPFEYSRFTWRVAALGGDTVDWDSFDDETDFQRLAFEHTGKDVRWLFFHKAAHEQRMLLDEKIPKTWIAS
jgi:hypothetical protein